MASVENSISHQTPSTTGRLWDEEPKFDESKDKKRFRDYDAACDRVKSFYKEQHEKQTVEFNIKARVNFKTKKRARMGVWDAMEMLNTLIDESDPDTTVSQIEHLLQTAEAIRRDGKPDWMQVAGLVHDLGKLLLLFGSEGQWDVVGCKFSDKIIYPDTFAANPDSYDSVYSTEYGIYKPNCGLDNVMLSWGHDEYLYNVFKDQSTLPEEALAMIRYHSFYPWHREGAYSHLTNEKDKKVLAAVQAFNPYDLYSKTDAPCNIPELRPYYERLIAKAIRFDEMRKRFLHNSVPTTMTDTLAPESTLPYPSIHKDKKFVVLSDWDGTITTRDSNDYLTDNLGYGKDKRREGNLEILAGRATFRDAFGEMLESVSAAGHTFQECKEILRRDIKLDPGFKEFYAWCKAKDIPVIIVSSGMAPLIRAVLSNLVGEEAANEINIIANDVTVHPDGKWEIQFRHPSRTANSLADDEHSGFGHDKSQAILPYRDLTNPPTLFFFGDGVSDISAAKHADLLFVKVKGDGENDLASYCNKEGIKHVLFEDFSKALPVVQSVVTGEKTVAQVIGA
ncbi:hypothetical protein D9615_006925 [Tricholomella constricta]|uniref:Inositol oxygenase n=1 Tax=Tricholomella constricta TaxID=117010 RepID=A0A8H5H8U6_9AGAR|nr:hypothetical protein D9615_006925 [Tricholomella constricta]